MRYVNLGTIHHIRGARKGEKDYYLDVLQQPFHRWLAWQAFHKFDMNKLVIKVSHLLERVERRFHDADIPLCARQDIYCYGLGEKDKVLLHHVQISQEDYERIKAGKPWVYKENS